MVPMQKDDAIGFRASAVLKRALEAAAAAQHRSLGQYCTLVLMKHLEKRGEWPPEDQPAGGGTDGRRATGRQPTRKPAAPGTGRTRAGRR